MISDQRSSGEDCAFAFEEGQRGRGKPVPLTASKLVFMLLFCFCSVSSSLLLASLHPFAHQFQIMPGGNFYSWISLLYMLLCYPKTQNTTNTKKK